MSLLCLKRFFNIRIHFEVCHLSMPVTEKLLYFCYYKFYMTTLAHQFSLSMVFDSLQPHGLYSTPGFPVHQQLLELAQTHVHPFGLCHSTILSSVAPFSFCPQSSQHQGLFKWVSALNQVPEYWSYSFSISPSNEYSGLPSFRIDLLHLLAVKGLSRVLSNTTVQKHQFFSAQLSL